MTGSQTHASKHWKWGRKMTLYFLSFLVFAALLVSLFANARLGFFSTLVAKAHSELLGGTILLDYPIREPRLAPLPTEVDVDLNYSDPVAWAFYYRSFINPPPSHDKLPGTSEISDSQIVRFHTTYGCSVFHNISDTILYVRPAFYPAGRWTGDDSWRYELAIKRQTLEIIDVGSKMFLYFRESKKNRGTYTSWSYVVRSVQNVIRLYNGNFLSDLPSLPVGYWMVPLYTQHVAHVLEDFLERLAHYYGGGLMAKQVPILVPAPVHNNLEFRNYNKLAKWIFEYLPDNVQVVFFKQQQVYRAQSTIFSATAFLHHHSPCSFQFMSQYLVPTVTERFRSGKKRLTLVRRWPTPRKLAILKTWSQKVGGRKIPQASASFKQMLQRNGFTLLPDRGPLDERLVLVNQADVVLTSWGSTYNILTRLWGGDPRSRPPIYFIILCYKDYSHEWNAMIATREFNYKAVEETVVDTKGMKTNETFNYYYNNCMELSVSHAVCKHIYLPGMDALEADGMTAIRPEMLDFDQHMPARTVLDNTTEHTVKEFHH